MPAANQIRVDEEPVGLIRQDHLIRVKNELDFVVKGRFAGQDYSWKPGEHHDISIPAAEHIFGFGKEESEKMRAMGNLGFMSKFGTFEASMEQMKSIKFSEPPALMEAPESAQKALARPRKSAGSSPSLRGSGDVGGPSSHGSSTEPLDGDGAVL